jgi:hypothetical protein
MSLNTLQKQLPQNSVYLSRVRLILYLFTFFTAVISILFYVAALLHHARTLAKDPTYILYVYRDVHFLCFVIIIPLFWSVAWSFIILRSLLKAINQTSLTNINQNQDDDDALSFTAIRSINNGLPITIMEVFLLLSLIVFGYWFGLRYTDYFLTSAVSKSSHNCPNRSVDDPIRLGFFCTTSYKQILALEVTALITLLMNVLIYLLLSVIAFTSSILVCWERKNTRLEKREEEAKKEEGLLL